MAIYTLDYIHEVTGQYTTYQSVIEAYNDININILNESEIVEKIKTFIRNAIQWIKDTFKKIKDWITGNSHKNSFIDENARKRAAEVMQKDEQLVNETLNDLKVKYDNATSDTDIEAIKKQVNACADKLANTAKYREYLKGNIKDKDLSKEEKSEYEKMNNFVLTGIEPFTFEHFRDEYADKERNRINNMFKK